jgi:ABC-type sugar transport system ATPase subunit
MNDVLCKIRNIKKVFPGVIALSGVGFDIRAGEVHAIVGENGAGKSTLMNILSGVYSADEGTIEFEGKQVRFKDTKEAQHTGIAMIHQELSLSPYLSAAENVFEGRMIKNKLGFIDRNKMYEMCTSYLLELGIENIDPKCLVEKLNVSEMQLIEVVKAMSMNAKMLIMDEPTSSLTNKEVDLMLKVVDTLRKSGVAVLYISHKLEEIMKIADIVTVLCDGKLIDTRKIDDIDLPTMINMMVGREFANTKVRNFIEDYESRKPILEVEHLYDMSGKVKDVSFTLFEGEVLGLTGLVGAGRSELLQTIFGANKIKSGKIKLNGKPVNIKSTRDAINHGLALIPEGRKIQGLFLDMSVEDNMTMVHLRHLRSPIKLINKKKAHQISEEYREKLKLKTTSLNQTIVNLSGGNQQKSIIARWLMNNPTIISMDEPTHGIDIGAKSEIYKIIDNLSKEGVSIIFLSSELPEVLANCDRIMVMHHGELRGVLNNKDATQVKIMEFTLEKSAS